MITPRLEIAARLLAAAMIDRPLGNMSETQRRELTQWALVWADTLIKQDELNPNPGDL